MALPTSPVIVLTREPEDNRTMIEALSQRRVPVLEVPCLAVRFLDPVDLPSSPGFRAVLFTSRRGVQGLFRLRRHADLLSGEPRPLICSVGEATAHALQEHGIGSDLIADPPRGEVLARQLIERLEGPCRIAMVCGNLTTGKTEKMLADAGFDLRRIIVYENFTPDIPQLSPFPVAAVFTASPSAGRRLIEKNPWMRSCRYVAIGETTAAGLAEMGVDRITLAGSDPGDWIDTLYSAYQAAPKAPENTGGLDRETKAGSNSQR